MSDSSVYDWDAVRILTLAFKVVIHSWNQTVEAQWKLSILISGPFHIFNALFEN